MSGAEALAFCDAMGIREEQLRREVYSIGLVLEQAQKALDAALAAQYALVIECVETDGMTLRQAAQTVGLSFQRCGQIMAKRRLVLAEGWGSFDLNVTAAQRLATAREAFYLAKYAQEERAERYSLGYAEERRAFFGDQSAAQADETEVPLKWSGFHVGIDRERDMAS